MRVARRELLKQYLRHRRLGRGHYQKAEALMSQLIQQGAAGKTVRLMNGRKFEIVDQFEDQMTAFHTTGCARYVAKEHK